MIYWWKFLCATLIWLVLAPFKYIFFFLRLTCVCFLYLFASFAFFSVFYICCCCCWLCVYNFLRYDLNSHKTTIIIIIYAIFHTFPVSAFFSSQFSTHAPACISFRKYFLFLICHFIILLDDINKFSSCASFLDIKNKNKKITKWSWKMWFFELKILLLWFVKSERNKIKNEEHKLNYDDNIQLILFDAGVM